MAGKFAGRRHDTLNRFYTRASVGDLMVDQLGEFTPGNVLDLGAGEGSLSSAVMKRWGDAAVVTVDIDPTIVEDLRANLRDAGAGRHDHHVRDVLDWTLPASLQGHGAFDLAVCNPPFFRPAWNRDFARILQQANLMDACPSTADATAEILFLAQNLRMVRDGGKIILIAPDGLLTGWRMAPFRRAILRQHGIDCVVQLPNHSFHDTEARCFILIMTKNAGPSERIKLIRHDVEAGPSGNLFISRDAAGQRMDFDFHSISAAHGGRSATLRQLGAVISRGSIDTSARKSAGFPTFHTTDYRYFDDGKIALEDAGELPAGRRFVMAEAGDILMARVDRGLHRKVGIVVCGRAPVTDCVYRVRVPAEHRQGVFDALRSPAGVASLLAATKGVSARLLGKADLLDLPLTLSA